MPGRPVLVPTAAAAENPQNFGHRAVGSQFGRDQAACWRFAGAEQHRAGGVAEQHAGLAIGPVDHPAQGFRADHQRTARHAVTDELVGDDEAVKRAGAGRGNIEGESVERADLGLHESGAGGRGRVAGHRGDNDEIDLAGVDPGEFERWRGILSRRVGAMPEVVSPSAAMWRSLMPVRLTIQGPFVATIFSRSALVRIFSGAYAPVPRMMDDGKFSGLVGAAIGEFVTTRRATRRLARGSSPSPFQCPGIQRAPRSRGFIPASARPRSRDENFYT